MKTIWHAEYGFNGQTFDQWRTPCICKGTKTDRPHHHCDDTPYVYADEIVTRDDPRWKYRGGLEVVDTTD